MISSIAMSYLYYTYTYVSYRTVRTYLRDNELSLLLLLHCDIERHYRLLFLMNRDKWIGTVTVRTGLLFQNLIINKIQPHEYWTRSFSWDTWGSGASWRSCCTVCSNHLAFLKNKIDWVLYYNTCMIASMICALVVLKCTTHENAWMLSACLIDKRRWKRNATVLLLNLCYL